MRITLRRTTAPKRAVALPSPKATSAPFVKWVGGKTRLLPELALRASRQHRHYFEPFVGGGALFFHLQPAEATLCDLNAELIDCYTAVRDEVDAVIQALDEHRVRHSVEYYYSMRDRWNARTDHGRANRAARFIYLNKTCYNGLWRVNQRGCFNVPAGRYAKPSIVDPERLRAASGALQRTTLRTASFETILDQAGADDFVYFDPPYDPVSPSADFTSYTPGQFTSADQARLADVFRALAHRGCSVMLSNSDTPLVRRLYADFRIDQVWAPRAVNSRADARGAVPEVIVTSY